MVAIVKVGATVPVYKDDMTTAELDSIVGQLEAIGAVPAVSVDRTKDFIGLCYSVDKPAKDTAIMSAIGHNDDVLAKRGHEMRKETAVAINEALSADGRGPSELDVTVIEDSKRGEDNADALDEKIEVRRDGAETKTRGRRKG